MSDNLGGLAREISINSTSITNSRRCANETQTVVNLYNQGPSHLNILFFGLTVGKSTIISLLMQQNQLNGSLDDLNVPQGKCNFIRVTLFLVKTSSLTLKTHRFQTEIKLWDEKRPVYELTHVRVYCYSAISENSLDHLERRFAATDLPVYQTLVILRTKTDLIDTVDEDQVVSEEEAKRRFCKRELAEDRFVFMSCSSKYFVEDGEEKGKLNEVLFRAMKDQLERNYEPKLTVCCSVC